MARNLLQESPIETVMASLFSTSAANRASTLAGRHAVQPLGAGQIEEGLVDRQRLDQRRQREHHLADLAADPRIFFHVGPDHSGVRAQPQRLEHRHGRSHPEGAGDVAGRGDDAALAAADDHRLGGKRRIVALLDRGVEGVAIDMGDGERAEFVVAQQARRAAGAAARPTAARRRQGSRGRSRGSSRQIALPLAAERAAGPRDLGRIDSRAVGKRDQEISSPSICSSTPARKPGSRAAARICSGPVRSRRGKRLEPFRLLGDEGKRLNRQHFRRFRALA